MIVIKHVQQPNGTIEDVIIPNPSPITIDGEGLTILPALIDPHVHFRVPGAEHKENWICGASAAIRSGITTVIDMPNNTPACTTLERLLEKHQLVQSQIEKSQIPLRYHFYFGADQKNLKELPKVKDHAIGIKVFMGSSTGDLLIEDPKALEEVFKIASDLDMLVSVHAEDEEIIRNQKKLHTSLQDPSIHSKIRCRTAAYQAVKTAIDLSRKYHTRLCILHLSTKEELQLVREAKAEQLSVYAEVAPHHLLFSTSEYTKWGNKVLVNPPLREKEDQIALWEGIKDGTIDFIGTDHAPHTLQEKAQHYPKCPSGIPSIELLLPLMLNAVNEGKLDLTTLIKLTNTNISHIFRLRPNSDSVLVRLNRKKEVRDEHLKTKCQWSPYHGHTLTGWPIYTIIQGKIFHLKENESCDLNQL